MEYHPCHSQTVFVRINKTPHPSTSAAGCQELRLPRQTNRANLQAPSLPRPRHLKLRSKPGNTIPSLAEFRDELDATMGMRGRPTVADFDRDVIGTISPLMGMFPQSWDAVRY